MCGTWGPCTILATNLLSDGLLKRYRGDTSIPFALSKSRVKGKLDINASIYMLVEKTENVTRWLLWGEYQN
jgi:hypothetical protein